MQSDRERDERKRHDQLAPVERRCLGRRDGHRASRRKRCDPEEQAQLVAAPPDEAHRSSRSATRPMAISSPGRTRSRFSIRTPLTNVPFVLPRSSIHHSPSWISSDAWRADAASSGTAMSLSLKDALEAYEKDLIQDALKTSRGNRAKAARLLNTTGRIMNYKVKQLKIDWRRFKK